MGRARWPMRLKSARADAMPVALTVCAVWCQLGKDGYLDGGWGGIRCSRTSGTEISIT